MRAFPKSDGGRGSCGICGWSACSAHMGRAATRHRRSDCHPSRASCGCRGGHRRLLQLLQARDFRSPSDWDRKRGPQQMGVPALESLHIQCPHGGCRVGRLVGRLAAKRCPALLLASILLPRAGSLLRWYLVRVVHPRRGWTYSHDWVRQYLATNGLGWENGGSYCNTITPSVTVTFDRGASSELTSRAASLEGTTLMTPTTPHRAQAVVKCMGEPATIDWVLRSRDDSRNLRTRCDSLP